MSSVGTETDTPGPADNPIIEESPPLPGSGQGLGTFIRENLFKDAKNGILTAVFGVLLAYCAFRATLFVFFNEKINQEGQAVSSWEVISSQLRVYVVGGFPASGVGYPMLWGAVYVVVLALGLASGRRRGDTAPPMTRRTRVGIAAPPLLAVVVLLSMVETITPVLLTLGLLLPFLVGQRLRPAIEGTAVSLVVQMAALLGSLALWLTGGDELGDRLTTIPTVLFILAGAYLVVKGRRAAGSFTVTLALLAVLAFLLQTGGSPGNIDTFGGLLLTVNVAFISIVLCFPLGVVLALLRRSSFVLLKPIAILYIELIRGVPLISLLFMGQFAIGFFLPAGTQSPPAVFRAIIMFTLFSAAYVAEIVRGGLQSVPKGQTEAGQAVGLSPLTISRRIVLPQALRNSIPALVGQFIALLKDTTLLVIIGQFDLLGVSDPILASPAFQNQGYAPEVYAFVAFMFWVMCFSMSRASQRLETKLGVGTR